MQKRILLSLAFLILLFAGDRLGGELLEKVFLSSKLRFAQIYTGDLEADIVIIGNSRGIHMFHPPAIEDVTGKQVANISFNAMPAQMMPMIWRDYLKNHEAPDVLVLEVSCIGVVDKTGTLEQFSVLLDQNKELESLFQERNPLHYYGCKLSRLFRYNSLLFIRSQLFRKHSDQNWIQNSVINETMLKEMFKESTAHANKLDENLQALKEVIAIANENGVEVKPIVAPYLPKFFDELERFDSWLQWTTLGLEIPVDNYSLAIKETELFSDHLHLNESGAKALATKLQDQQFFDSKNAVSQPNQQASLTVE